MLYLASPYTHPDADVRQARYEAARLATAVLMRSGEPVYSPVVHGHAVASAHEMPTGHDFWMRHCLTMLARADRMAVLMLDGWQESTGVRAEIEQWRKWWRYEPIYLGPDNPPPAHMSLRETVDALRAVWATRDAEVAE